VVATGLGAGAVRLGAGAAGLGAGAAGLGAGAAVGGGVGRTVAGAIVTIVQCFETTALLQPPVASRRTATHTTVLKTSSSSTVLRY
jgi:hypothetical protein